MADTDNPEAHIPQTRFGDHAPGKTVRRERTTGPGFVGRVSQFLRDVRAEMRRVSWPTSKEVKNTTLITLVAVIFFGIYLFLVDLAWSFLITQLYRLLNWLTGTA